MIDTSVQFAGLTLPSPIFVGAGPNTRTVKSCVEALNAGAGAVEIWGPPGDAKSVPHVRIDDMQILPSKKSAIGRRYFSIINTGSRRQWVDEESIEARMNVIRSIKKRKHKKGAVVSSIGYVTYQLDERSEGLGWGELAKLSEEAGADAVSLHLQTGQDVAGKILTEKPKRLPGIIEDVKKHCSIPVIAKLPVEGCDPVELARIAVKAGADAIAPTARFVGLAIDVETENVQEWEGFHGIGGPWALPITTAWTAKMRRDGIVLPLIPGGGVMSWQDIVKLILVGANMVQVCTWPILKGYKSLIPALDRIKKWMNQKGYSSLDDFRGKSISKIKEARQLWDRLTYEGYYENVIVDAETCTGCQLCLNPCYFEAISMDAANKAKINSAKCVGCGCCYHICPYNAITAETATRKPMNF